MKNRIKQFTAIAALFVFVSSITSCNRGYGCPNNFKAKVVNTVVDNIVASNIVASNIVASNIVASNIANSFVKK